ncbi:kinase-like protein, partial [Gonapodya prolifera JEL478]
PYVLPFYGVSCKGGKIVLASPYVENGNAAAYLEKLKSAGALLFDIARGLKYLHENNILHVDVSPENALVNKLRRAMIVDFTTCGFRELEMKNGNEGSLFYMAPERLQGMAPSTKADVYAFGITMYSVSKLNLCTLLYNTFGHSFAFPNLYSSG